MRAMIRCFSDVDCHQWEGILEKCDWRAPSEPWLVDEQRRKKSDILALMAPDDKEIFDQTYLTSVVYNESKRTWCLLSSPAKGVLEFRFVNESSKQLTEACSHFVWKVSSYMLKYGVPSGLKFRFDPTVEVRQNSSPDLEFYGEIMPLNKWQLALDERRWEWMISKLSAIIAVSLGVFTMPPVEAAIWTIPSGPWTDWLDGNLGRLSTSFFVTGFISAFNVLAHYYKLKRRDGQIRWQLWTNTAIPAGLK